MTKTEIHYPLPIGGSFGGSFTGIVGALICLGIDGLPPIIVLAIDVPRVGSGRRPRLRVIISLAEETFALPRTAGSRSEDPARNDSFLASDFNKRFSLCESCGVVGFLEKILFRKDIKLFIRFT